MKNLMIAFWLLLLTGTAFSQKKTIQTKRQVALKTSLAKYHDNIDDRMKGPNGEAIYIGPNGGRYYIKNGKKVYVEYKGNKK